MTIACGCEAPRTECDGFCTVTDVDRQHCGGCAGNGGTVCADDEACLAGTCGTIGIPSETYCDATQNWDAGATAIEFEVLDWVNHFRARGYTCGSRGYFAPAGPLQMQENLRCAARVHSLDMATNNYFDHDSQNGDSPWDRIKKALAGTLGAEEFSAFLESGEPPATDQLRAGIESAVDVFDLVLTEYVDVELSKGADYGWAEATTSFQDGDAALMFHGDWAKGYLVSLGFTPGIDFGVAGPPGAEDLFIYGADTFVLPTTAPQKERALEFLSVVASKEGQTAFSRYKGSTPMRSDVRDDLDAPGKVNLDSLVGAKVLMKGHANSSWDEAIESYAEDGDKAALLEVYLKAVP